MGETNCLVPVTFLYGPSGVGKTTLAHVMLRNANYHVYELNAGEVRSKKRIKDVFERILNNSSVSMMKKKDQRQKVAIVMDEIDGMSCGDRGGLHELFNILAQNTGTLQHPVICIGNRPYDKKTHANLFQEFHIRYPSEVEVKRRLTFIAQQEQVPFEDGAISHLVTFCGKDIRRSVHLLQEVFHHFGCDHNRMHSREDIEQVIASSSNVKSDWNIFDASGMLFSSQNMGIRDMCANVRVDSDLMTMMLHENLHTQIQQKKLPMEDASSLCAEVLHNMCIRESVTTSTSASTAVSQDALACISCGYANLKLSHKKNEVSHPKKMLYTNTLTKLANEASVTQHTYRTIQAAQCGYVGYAHCYTTLHAVAG